MTNVELWVAIIGCYVVTGSAIMGLAKWCLNRHQMIKDDVMEEIKTVAKHISHLANLVRIHHEDSSIHDKTNGFVREGECKAITDGIRAQQQMILDRIKEGFESVEKALDNMK